MVSLEWSKSPDNNRLTSRSPVWLHVCVAGFALFVLLTALVQVRLLRGIDYAAGVAVLPIASGFLDNLSTALSIVFSGELTGLFAIVASLALWHRGYGIWSLGPFAFLAPNALEVVMKIVVDQPPVPAELHRTIFYPLATVNLAGSFPSGHALRTAFVCAFLAVLPGMRTSSWRWIAWFGLAMIALMAAFTRVYLGDHWLSDVIGGILLGGSTAGLVVRPDRHPATVS